VGNLVCKCLHVEESEIAEAIRAGARSVEAIGERCEAGTGCTACHDLLQGLLDAAEARQASRNRRAGTPQLPLFPEG